MKKNTSAFTLIELLVVITIIAILASIALPVFNSVTERANQTKDLSNAKQIGLGLKLFAGDNDGKFPVAVGNANTAFAQLVPQYITTEKVFYLAKSAWTPAAPDEVTSPATEAVKSGENNFAYVNNLTDTSNPNFPLLADGFSSAAGTYATAETAKGGVWKGKKAIVIRADLSGNVEKCTTAFKVFGKTGSGSADADIFASGSTWLDSSQAPLNPQ